MYSFGGDNMRNMEIGTSLKCSACGSDQFLAINDGGIVSLDTTISCSECGLITNKGGCN